MLLSDPEIAAQINRDFVPCWESVRPVPKVTIDFGNGHKIERTLQGNTIMYVCLPSGHVVDALPGVYTPENFKEQTGATLAFLHGLDAKLNADKSGLTLPAAIRDWHKSQIQQAILGEQMRITVGKAFVESPLLDALHLRVRPVYTPIPAPASASGPPLAAGQKPTAPAGTAAGANGASVTFIKVEAATPPIDNLPDAFAKLTAQIEDISHRPATVRELTRSLPPSVFPARQATASAVPAPPLPGGFGARGGFPQSGGPPAGGGGFPAGGSGFAFGGSPAPDSPDTRTPEQIGRDIVIRDSQNNVRVVRPAVHIYLAMQNALPLPAQCRDTIYKQILHVPIDDPDLGLADALVPGTPPSR